MGRGRPKGALSSKVREPARNLAYDGLTVIQIAKVLGLSIRYTRTLVGDILRERRRGLPA